MARSELPKLGEAESPSTHRGQAALAELRAGAGAWQRDDLALDPTSSTVRRFAHAGFTPFILLRRVWRDPVLRRTYLRATLPVALLTLLVGMVSAGQVVARRLGQRPTPPRVAPQQRVPPVAPQPPAVAAKGAPHVEQDDGEDGDDGKDEVDDDQDEGEEDPPEARAPEVPASPALRTAEAIKQAALAAAHLKAGPKPPPGHLSATLSTDGDSDGDEDEPDHEAAWWTAVYGAMVMAEWCLLALTRHHQDQLARQVALATAVPPDDPEEQARLSIDIPWLFRKLKRKWLGTLMFAICLLPATFLSPFLGTWGARIFYALLAGGWGVYWSGVFALGRSKLAWTHGLAGDPWFTRPEALLGRYGGLVRWFGPRIYLRLLKRVTRSVTPAALAFELAYPEAFGLGLVRVLCGFPMVYTLTRPVFGVAASHVLLPHLKPASSDPAAAVATEGVNP